jgi:hypothetical protein
MKRNYEKLQHGEIHGSFLSTKWHVPKDRLTHLVWHNTLSLSNMPKYNN